LEDDIGKMKRSTGNGEVGLGPEIVTQFCKVQQKAWVQQIMLSS